MSRDIATEFRQRFKRDIVIDMFCYRRHGHNESDEPMFTQPLMYKKIAGHKTVKEVYAARLDAEGVVDAGRGPGDRCGVAREARQGVRGGAPATSPTRPTGWRAAGPGSRIAPGEEDRKGATAVELDQLKEVGRAISEPPKNFDLNRKIARLLQDKRKAIETGKASTGRPARRWPGEPCWPKARRCG